MAETVERLAVLIEANTKQFENAMKRLEKVTQQSMSKSTAAVRSLDSQMKAISATAARFLQGFAIGAGSAFLSQLPRMFADIVREADKLADTARLLGLTTDELQELHFAAGKVSVEAGKVDKAMQGFARRIAEAAAGGGELAKILSANGVELRNADGTIRGTVEVLGDYANLIRGAASEQDQLLLATKAFGEEGAALVGILKGGAGALIDLRNEAHSAGAVIRSDLLDTASAVNDRWTELNANISTRFKSAALQTLDVIDILIGKLKETDPVVESWLTKWAKINPLVGGALAGAVGIGGAIGARNKSDPFADLIGSVDRRLLSTPISPTTIPGGGAGDSIFSDKPSKAVLNLSNQIEELERSITGAQEAAMFFGETAADAFMSMVPAIRTGNQALDQLLNTLIKAAAQALLLGQGPLAGLFGTSAAPNALGGLFGGFRASGGPVAAGKAYMVGERGPELFVSRDAGRIIPAAGNAAPARVVVEAAPSAYFDLRVREVSGEVAVQTTGAGIASYDQRKSRQQKLAG